MRITRQILGLAAASLVGLATTARAQADIEFAGAAFGCFTTTSCTPVAIAPPFAQYAQLVYTPGGFDVTTTGGFASFSAGDLGRFFLTASNFDYGNPQMVFELTLSFASCNFITGVCTPNNLPTAGDQLFVGKVPKLKGKVKSDGSGGVHIDWAGPADFSFTEIIGGVTYTGDAEITLNSLDIHPGLPTGDAITGGVTVDNLHSNAPEPASIALFATGLVGMIPVVRYGRRKRA